MSEDIEAKLDDRIAEKNIFGCVICRKSAAGGNSAAPVKDGLCCDDCNANHVIPARFKALFHLRK